MKALVKREAGKGIWLEDVSQPDVGVNDSFVSLGGDSLMAVAFG